MYQKVSQGLKDSLCFSTMPKKLEDSYYCFKKVKQQVIAVLKVLAKQNKIILIQTYFFRTEKKEEEERAESHS